MSPLQAPHAQCMSERARCGGPKLGQPQMLLLRTRARAPMPHHAAPRIDVPTHSATPITA